MARCSWESIKHQAKNFKGDQLLGTKELFFKLGETEDKPDRSVDAPQLAGGTMIFVKTAETQRWGLLKDAKGCLDIMFTVYFTHFCTYYSYPTDPHMFKSQFGITPRANDLHVQVVDPHGTWGTQGSLARLLKREGIDLSELEAQLFGAGFTWVYVGSLCSCGGYGMLWWCDERSRLPNGSASAASSSASNSRLLMPSLVQRCGTWVHTNFTPGSWLLKLKPFAFCLSYFWDDIFHRNFELNSFVFSLFNLDICWLYSSAFPRSFDFLRHDWGPIALHSPRRPSHGPCLGAVAVRAEKKLRTGNCRPSLAKALDQKAVGCQWISMDFNITSPGAVLRLTLHRNFCCFVAVWVSHPQNNGQSDCGGHILKDLNSSNLA